MSRLSGALWLRGGERKESLQLRLWTLNSISISLVASCRLSCQIPADQREAEMIANVDKHCKTRVKGNDVITKVRVFANQHFASTFSMQIFKFQRRTVVASSPSFPRPAAGVPRRACSQANRNAKEDQQWFMQHQEKSQISF